MLDFPRDPIVAIGDTLIETAMFDPARRMERFPIRRALADRLDGCRVAAIPEPSPVSEDAQGSYGPGPFLEGGDVFVLSNEIYVGHTGNASNQAGAEPRRRPAFHSASHPRRAAAIAWSRRRAPSLA